MLRVLTETIDDVTIVKASGSIDIVTRSQLKDAACLYSLNDDVVFNLAEVDFIDSSGLSTLVDIIRRFRGGPMTLVLAAPPAHIRDVLEMTSVDQLVRILDTVREAIELIKKNA